MNQEKRLREYLKHFTENQKEIVAELVAFDCMLSEIWQEQITRFITRYDWQPNVLLKSLVDRAEEIVTDMEQHGFFTEFNKRL